MLARNITLSLLAAAAASLALCGVALWRAGVSGLDALEAERAADDLARVELAIENLASHLDIANLDYSMWTDTYDFVRGENADYEDANLYHYSFYELEVHMMLFYDAAGRLHWGKFMGVESAKEFPLDQVLHERLAPDDPLVRHEDLAGNVRGLMRTKRGPMIVTSRPILTDEGMGPSAGALIFGRLLDAPRVEQIEQLTRASLSLIAPGAPDASAEDRRALAHAKGLTPYTVRSGESTFSYRLLSDVYGEPAYLLRVETPLEIAREGRRILALGLACSAGVIGLLLAATALLLQRRVGAPLVALARFAARARSGEQAGQRLGWRRADELGALAGEVDGLAEELEKARGAT